MKIIMANQKKSIVTKGILLTVLTFIGCAVKAPPELTRATMSGDIAAVRFVLTKNPKLLNAENEDGWTALHMAAYKGYKDMVEFLLAKGAKVTSREDHFGQTPLHDAAQYGHKDIAEMLIEHGARASYR